MSGIAPSLIAGPVADCPGRGGEGTDGGGLTRLPPGFALPTVAQQAAVVRFALAQLGKPYLWGATGTASFDCSGLTGWAFRQAGVNLPRTSRQQWFAGPHVGLADLAPGDLLFWADDVARPGSIHHVALYVGGGRMIAAPRAGTLVREQAVYASGYIGAVRPGVASG